MFPRGVGGAIGSILHRLDFAHSFGFSQLFKMVDVQKLLDKIF